MIIVVEYLPQLSRSGQLGDIHVAGLRLVPGNNEVDKNKWEQALNYDLIQRRIQEGIIRSPLGQPTIIVSSDSGGKKEKAVTRNAVPVETKLETEIELTPVSDAAAFVVRPPEVEKASSAKK